MWNPEKKSSNSRIESCDVWIQIMVSSVADKNVTWKMYCFGTELFWVNKVWILLKVLVDFCICYMKLVDLMPQTFPAFYAKPHGERKERFLNVKCSFTEWTENARLILFTEEERWSRFKVGYFFHYIWVNKNA